MAKIYYKKELLNEKGFSLLEVLIALVILSVGLLAMANMQIMGIGGNSSGQKITIATTLAQDALEKITNLNYSSLPVTEAAQNFDNDFPVYNNGYTAPYKTFMGVDYTRNYTVDINYPIANTATIQVTVNWVDSKGKTHGVTESSVKRSD